MREEYKQRNWLRKGTFVENARREREKNQRERETEKRGERVLEREDESTEERRL